MARTESTMLALGTLAPDFALTDVISGNTIRRDDAKGKKALLVLFLCPHCPYVKHVEAELAQIGRDYTPQSVAIVAINSNDIVNYPQDDPDGMRAQAAAQGFVFPYLLDETQSVAKAYAAACTPDIFLFDASFELVYRGQLDQSRPKSDIPVTGKDLRSALDAVLADQSVSAEQTPSLGCNIKWK